MFSIMNYKNPLRGIASMHCSANTNMEGTDSAIFFGLKTDYFDKAAQQFANLMIETTDTCDPGYIVQEHSPVKQL